MYTLVSALGKPVAVGKRWESIDLTTLTLRQFFAQYRRGYAILSHPVLPNHVCFDLAHLKAQYGHLDTLLPEYFLTIGTATLPTTTQLPSLNPQFVEYADAFHAGYKIKPVHPTASHDSPTAPEERTALFLTRADTSYTLFQESCLVTVNGFFHRTDTDGRGIYVVDGQRSATIGENNQLGIHSFRKLGKLRTITITDDMLYRQNPDVGLGVRAYLDTGEDLTDKTVMLVLGGYLHVLDTAIFSRVGDRQFRIDFENLPLLSRLQDSLRYLDLNSLPMERTSNNLTQMAVADVYSDENIRAYCTLSQSFLVVLDNTDLFLDFEPLLNSKIFRLYTTSTKPKYPVILSNGKMMDYWYVPEDGQYAITGTDTEEMQYSFFTVDPRIQTSVDNSVPPADPSRKADAMFRYIGTELTFA